VALSGLDPTEPAGQEPPFAALYNHEPSLVFLRPLPFPSPPNPRLAREPPAPLHRSKRGNSVRVWGKEPASPTSFSSPSAAAARGVLPVLISKTLSPGAVGLEPGADRWAASHGAHQQQQHGAALAAAPRARPPYDPAAIPSCPHPNSPFHFSVSLSPLILGRRCGAGPRFPSWLGLGFENSRTFGKKMLHLAICVACNSVFSSSALSLSLVHDFSLNFT
jgi:hypothetical protein